MIIRILRIKMEYNDIRELRDVNVLSNYDFLNQFVPFSDTKFEEEKLYQNKYLHFI
jgi:hypothetical protein